MVLIFSCSFLAFSIQRVTLKMYIFLSSIDHGVMQCSLVRYIYWALEYIVVAILLSGYFRYDFFSIRCPMRIRQKKNEQSFAKR